MRLPKFNLCPDNRVPTHWMIFFTSVVNFTPSLVLASVESHLPFFNSVDNWRVQRAEKVEICVSIVGLSWFRLQWSSLHTPLALLTPDMSLWLCASTLGLLMQYTPVAYLPVQVDVALIRQTVDLTRPYPDVGHARSFQKSSWSFHRYQLEQGPLGVEWSGKLSAALQNYIEHTWAVSINNSYYWFININ